MRNEYLSYPALIENIRDETPDTKTFKVVFKDKKLIKSFRYQPGQFMEAGLPGVGEAPISITSSPWRKGYLEFCIRKTGKVTDAMHNLKKKDILFLRGPYGNGFPLASLKGKNLYFIAGGIGLAPLRSLINQVFGKRKNFKQIKILYGAKTPDELCFKDELEIWKKIPDTQVWLTVDKPCDGWGCSIGVVTELWSQTEVYPKNAVAIVCGPPIMMKFVIQKLLASGFSPKDIIMTLERYMKCGIGKCGHCNIAEKFVCIDGPVFSYAQAKIFPPHENIF